MDAKLLKRADAVFGEVGFYRRLFPYLFHEEGRGGGIAAVLADPLPALSAACELSGLQEASSVRACLKARLLAIALMGENGELLEEPLQEAILALKGHLHSLGPSQQGDVLRNAHMLNILGRLSEDSDLRRKLSAIDEPIDNGVGQRLVRETLHLDPKKRVDVGATRRAALAALLTPLRQNVGSCFATAPAILVQREQPDLLLEDLRELLATGRLTRVVEGTDHSIPLCPSWGVGDLLQPISAAVDIGKLSHSPGLQLALGEKELEPLLQKALAKVERITTPREIIRSLVEGERQVREAEAAFKSLTDNALLKAWEFTLASYCETKTSFSRWNLYVSLGLQPEEEGGIGAVIKREVEGKFEQANRQVEDAQSRYEIIWQAVKFAEGRLRRASEEEGRWLKADYRRKVVEMEGYLEERDIAHARAERLAAMLATLVERYSSLFPEYFQEVYDPEMHDVGPSPYDDSPAGFRLLYKHGRRNPSMWTLVHTPDDFINTLVEFFISTEVGITQMEQMEGLERDLSEVISAVVNQLRTPRFLESAFDRMARRYGKRPVVKPLDNLDKVEAKPWSYVSGGTMAELVATYWRREPLPTLRERKIENAFDLFVYLIETMKEMPARVTNDFLGNPEKSLLIQSPTHAFNFRPGLAPFRDGWLDKGHTPTWVRDLVIRPQESAGSAIRLGLEEMEELIARVGSHLPPSLRPTLRHAMGPLPLSRYRVRDFRELIARAIGQSNALKFYAQTTFFDETIDQVLYTTLPFLPGHQLEGTIKLLLSELLPAEVPELGQLPLPPRLVGAREVYDACLALLVSGRGSATDNEDLPGELRSVMEREGLALPRPVFFADTNWVREYFGLLVNPATGRLELWRSDRLGWEAAPMIRWRGLIRSRQKWAAYTRPHEYLR